MSERIIKKNNFFIPLFSGLIALILIASGTFYLFSRLGVFKKSEVPIIRAPETPVKVKPEISGGKNIDYTNCKVCMLLDPQNENSETVEIFTPLSNVPEPPAIALPENDNKTYIVDALKDNFLTEDNNSIKDDNISISVSNGDNTSMDDAGEIFENQNDIDSMISKPSDLNDKIISPPVSKPISGYYVQLAAFNSKKRAETAVKILNEKFAVTLDGRILKIMQVDLGVDKGYWWRIISNKLTRENAESTCALLKSKGQGCIVRSE